MDNFNAMLLQLENPVELFAELLVFIGIYVQRENLRSFETRIFRAYADPSRTPAFVLQQLLAFHRQHEIDKQFGRVRSWRIL